MGISFVRKSSKKKESGSALVKIVVGVSIFVFTFMFLLFMDKTQVYYGETLNMGWMIVYTFMNQIASHIAYLLIGVVVLYIAYSFNWKIGIAVSIIYVCIFIILTPDFMDKYKVNGDGNNLGGAIINQLKDIISEEYEVIQPEECKMLNHTVVTTVKRSTSEKTYYYLMVDGNKNIIPLTGVNNKLIEKFLNYTEIKELKVHKYTRFIVEINGIKINELTETMVEELKGQYEMDLIAEMSNDCKLQVNSDNTLNVILGENVDGEDFCVSTFTPDKKLISSLGYKRYERYPMATMHDGIWCVFVTDGWYNCVSNIVIYEVVDGKIENVREGTYDTLKGYLPPKSYYEDYN